MKNIFFRTPLVILAIIFIGLFSILGISREIEVGEYLIISGGILSGNTISFRLTAEEYKAVAEAKEVYWNVYGEKPSLLLKNIGDELTLHLDDLQLKSVGEDISITLKISSITPFKALLRRLNI